MFIEFSDKYIYINHELVERSSLNIEPKGLKNIYEVFRVISGSPLFVDDHLQRLQHSLKLTGIDYEPETVNEIKEIVSHICKANNKYFGNIELRVVISEGGEVNRFIGFISHYYPEPVHYIEGVKLDYIEAIRKNPTIKAKYTSTREIANLFLKENKQYEVLLANHDGGLTEGSRSNLFLIKENTIYTAPDELVLCGITRLNVIRLLKKMHYKIVYKTIKISDINTFDAAFICGTSPGVLPIAAIRDTKFDTSNSILRNIIMHYNDQISSYITTINQ